MGRSRRGPTQIWPTRTARRATSATSTRRRPPRTPSTLRSAARGSKGSGARTWSSTGSWCRSMVRAGGGSPSAAATSPPPRRRRAPALAARPSTTTPSPTPTRSRRHSLRTPHPPKYINNRTLGVPERIVRRRRLLLFHLFHAERPGIRRRFKSQANRSRRRALRRPRQHFNQRRP